MIGILAQVDGCIVTVACGKGDALAILQRTQRESFPDSAVLGFHDPDDFPSYRFRDCWRWVSGALAVDMTLAREQRLSEIRADRAWRFGPLDAQWMRALGQGKAAEAAAVEAKRQTLRVIPQMMLGVIPLDGVTLTRTLADCKTPDDIATLEPTWPE